MKKEITNFEGLYEADEDGNIYSITRQIISKTGQKYILHGRKLKPNKTKNGYLLVHLCKNGKRTALYVHQIIAELFVPNPKNLPIVNHKNGKKSECYASNLEWTTYTENNIHAYNTGLRLCGEKQYNAKLTEKDVIEIRKNGKYDTFKNIAKKYNVTGTTIRSILIGKTWNHTSYNNID